MNTELFADYFTEKGHIVRIATWTEDQECKPFPYEVIRKPSRLQLMQHHVWADVILENNPCLRLAWPRLLFRKPYVVALNTWVKNPESKLNLPGRVKQLWLKGAGKVIAASHALQQKVYPKATVISNPYRKELFRVMQGVPRNKAFVFLGRLVSDKGADQAIYAVYRLKQLQLSGCNIGLEPDLTIIGNGPERGKLEKMVQELELQAQVRFMGAMHGEDLVHCLNQHQYMLIPSVWEEPFGMVALEGMACGCLPIASDGGGLPEAVGKGGVTFRRNNGDAMFACILHLLQNPALEQSCRAAVTGHLEAHQSQLVAEKYLQVIESVA